MCNLSDQLYYTIELVFGFPERKSRRGRDWMLPCIPRGDDSLMISISLIREHLFVWDGYIWSELSVACCAREDSVKVRVHFEKLF